MTRSILRILGNVSVIVMLSAATWFMLRATFFVEDFEGQVVTYLHSIVLYLCVIVTKESDR